MLQIKTNEKQNEMAKTRDGLKVDRVARAIDALFGGFGFEVREGSRHPYTVSLPGAMVQPCAIAESTDVRRQVAPFIARYAGMSAQDVYNQIRGAA